MNLDFDGACEQMAGHWSNVHLVDENTREKLGLSIEYVKYVIINFVNNFGYKLKL